MYYPENTERLLKKTLRNRKQENSFRIRKKGD